MKLTFYGASKEVTGSNYLLESGGEKILIDCGLHQGSRFCERQNFDPFEYDPKEISAVFVTHAHIDHTGRLPKLSKEGLKGKVYSTFPTRDFAELLLLDSVHILDQEAENFKFPKIYGNDDITNLMKLWEGVEYHQKVKLKNFEIEFYNAGHILGSSFIVVSAEGKKIVFSGDLGNSPAPIIGMKEFVDEADYCLMESTYGNRIHEKADERKEILEDLIEDTVKKSGVLMIPAFAMERTQELLFELNDLVESGRIPPAPVFVDSPLAIKLTTIYKKYEEYFDKSTQALIQSGEAIFNFPGLKMTLTVEESKTINDVKPPKIIIAGSGMSTAGRILHHERRYLSDPNNTLLIIGYQSKGSLGRRILQGDKSVRILGEEVAVQCRVQAIGAYSAHADREQLYEWLKPMRLALKKTFLVHGEEEESLPLASRLRDELAINVEVPDPKSTYEL